MLTLSECALAIPVIESTISKARKDVDTLMTELVGLEAGGVTKDEVISLKDKVTRIKNALESIEHKDDKVAVLNPYEGDLHPPVGHSVTLDPQLDQHGHHVGSFRKRG